ncbi:MAG: tetratricopeptide repeat protein [Candidatus Pacearchaeota archaeon]|nr:tetratricopeptide repeat protein [Candidatus Pacearchaeota archaeon]
MKNLIKLAGLLALVLAFGSCRDNSNRSEPFKSCLKSAMAYNYLGKEESALEYLDSLQIGIRKEYSKRLSGEELVELSEIYSRACLERGKIYKEEGKFDLALDAFNEVITSYLGYDLGKSPPSWDPVLEAYIEMAEIFEKMGDVERAERYRNVIKLLAN